MYPRTDRKKDGKKPNEINIREEERADESFGLNTSIGNQALIENLDEILSSEEDLLSENVPQSQDMITHRPVHRHKTSRAKNIIVENGDNSFSEESDIETVEPEEVRIKRYDEKSDNELPIKPLKPQKPEKTKKRSKKPAAGKTFVNEINIMNENNIMNDNLITNEDFFPRKKKKKPLIGMPEKDSDSEDSKSRYFEPLIKIADSESGGNNIDAASDKAGGISNLGDFAGIGRSGFGRKIAENEELLLDAIGPAAGGLQIADESDDEETGSTYAKRDPSLVGEGARSKKGKKNGNDLLLPQQSIVEGMEELDPDKKWKDEALEYARKQSADPAFLAEEMEKIKNWNFVPQKMKETPQKLGRWRRFLSFLGWGVGKTIGKILPLLTGGWIFNYFAKKRANQQFNNMQERRKHEQIPGWDGAEYDPNENQGAQILNDFRRIPTVWAQPTAAKAVGENGRPLDPVISIMIDQPKTMSAKTMKKKEVGHAMIGIEYSRFSKITDRFERYSLQYGFYPQGNVANKISPIMLGIYRDAKVPGELQNDAGHQYDVSRSYPAKQNQVNKIIQASEHYADKGYGVFSRNCTTFVKEMVVDTAHLNVGDDIFKMSDVRISSLGNLALFAGSSLTSNAMAGSSNNLMDLSNEEDLTYHGYGNKRATQQDYLNYKESLNENNGGYSKMTYSPAQTGENLRRASGENEGQIGSYKYDKPLLNNEGTPILTPFKLRNVIYNEGNDLYELFSTVNPLAMQGTLPAEAFDTITLFSAMGSSLKPIDDKLDEYAEKNNLELKDVKAKDAVPLKLIVDARQEIAGYAQQVSKLLTKYFQNDKRLHKPVMNFISLLQHAVHYLDTLYGERFNKEKLGGDLENIRDDMGNGEYTVKVGEDKENFTPSHYESYIQIYKTPIAAIRAYHRYKDLKAKIKREEDLTKAEKEEYDKLEKMESLALDFDRAHKYMLEKDSYKQQDIDYAFQLQKKERTGGVISGMFNSKNSSSGIYLSLILEKIFGGMTKRFMKEETEEGGISRGDVSDLKKMKAWLENEMDRSLSQKEDDMELIVRGLKKTMENPNERSLMTEVRDLIQKYWLDRIFSDQSTETKMVLGNLQAENSLDRIIRDEKSPVHKRIKRLVDKVLQEDQPQLQNI